ncbi:hypothetical protein [Kitasatospora sp. NPDC097691]|uniref:hypothetical protein n=1 Tax=Kitasatospora sp. NPDC097691 TaxID=3157231 RepID=UPI00331E7727
MDDFTYADPATLSGRLQRGRGLAARRLRSTPEDADLVYECVISDSRWDRQTESRDSYLARLIHRLDLPLARVEAHLFGYDGDDSDEVALALQVLALLPVLGRIDAAPILRRYAIEGRHWAVALDAIEWTGPRQTPELWAGLDAEVVARHDDAELEAHADDGGWVPWTSWALTQPRLRRILDGRPALRAEPPARPPAPDHGGLSSSDLAARITRAPGRDRRLALQELGRRGDATVLDLAEDTGLRNAAGWTPGIPQALHHLGTAAVARARTWADSGDRTLEHLALGVLSAFGDHDDGPYLLHALTTAAAAGEWCMTEEPARGVGRLRLAEATDALVHVWETTVHSYAREAVHEGLRGCAPDTAGGFTVEGLDDCEPLVRQAAAAVAPDTADAVARLRELSDDPLAAEFHAAARRRLAQLTDPGRAG